MVRIKEQYLNEMVPKLMEKFAYRNAMQVPKIEKVVLNMGVGEAIQNPKSLDGAVADPQPSPGKNR